jgi:sugar phosphate isomerase/epimerase
MSNIGTALQLYTVRELTAKNFAAAIEEVAQIGFKAVELAGFGSLRSAREVRKVLDSNGVRAISSHTALDLLEKDPNRVMDDNDALGNKNLVVPYLAEDRREDAAGWRKVADVLTRIARTVQARGFQLAYHNHAFEFVPMEDGKRGIDILWENTDPALVRSELDTFWVKHGGEDPVGYVRKLGQRMLLLHVKDMAEGEEHRFAPVGTGLLDFDAILKACDDLGVQWAIVEQDATYQTPPLEAARLSLENLRRLGLN